MGNGWGAILTILPKISLKQSQNVGGYKAMLCVILV